MEHRFVRSLTAYAIYDLLFICSTAHFLSDVLSYTTSVLFYLLEQWFSTTVMRAACDSQAPLMRPSAVFNKTSIILCNRPRSVL